ncbi:MAG TPA: D-alanyl-D-alanine carboxypeptidase/D-alanyl-D-alanine-endopeptidase [Bdellovibrionota bacterium]|jgi:D-alanyl-D-alanine carboxypeptidase/D-alanyl-D-alanine-endopeptidase (penicillin-binding protein 4)|nr:D-alanyl-D-alanine carboxypeptidase/D-alanyl-D-alanine-endopeptidase [Bdellovibrionota bacterium]
MGETTKSRLLTLAVTLPAFLGACAPPPAPRATLYAVIPPGARVDWDSLLHRPDTADLEFGVKILGPEPYAQEAAESFAPASNTKLFTTAAALRYLGPESTFDTNITWDWAGRGVAAHLKLHGGGDPTWTPDTLDTIVSALKKAGVQAVQGPVESAAADPRADILRRPEGWQPEDSAACYAALIQSLNLNEDCATLKVLGLHSAAWTDPDVPIPVEVRLKPGLHTDLQVESVDQPGRPATSYLITGTWKAGTPPVPIALPVHDAPEWVARALRRRLASAGLWMPTDSGDRREPATEGASLKISSAPLGQILVPFDKNSDNFIGHAYWAALGARLGDPQAPDLLEAGRGVMARFIEELGRATALRLGLAPRPGFYASRVTLVDGSGISHADQVTVDALIMLLQDLSSRGDFGYVWRALPIAGVDGTLASRMKNTAAQGVLRAKTGTLTGVYNLSGFVPRLASGEIEGGPAGSTPAELIPFVVLTRGPGGSATPAHAAQDRVGAALAELINP